MKWSPVVTSLTSLVVPVVAACSSQDSATIQLVTGEETDTFTRSPAPTKLRVDAIDTSHHDSVLATAPLPTATIDLGRQDESTMATLEAAGLDANGLTLVFGASLPVNYGGLAGLTIPIFVQRTGELARLPGPLSDARQAPTVAVVQGQYLFVGAGNDPSLSSTTQLYDFLSLAPLPSPPSLPRTPESIAFVGTVAWLIDTGGGTYFDFSNGSHSEIAAPPGASFADVAGGATVIDDSGALYVVGATRAGGNPSATVLKVDPNDTSNSNYPNGNPSWLKLTAPRLGACATWVKGHGLVVAAGSPTAPGVEIVPPNELAGAPLAYAPDPSVGSGASTLDTQSVLLAGGVTPAIKDAGVRAVDLGCASQCAPQPWSELPVPLVSAQAFTLDPANAFVAGSDPSSGATHAYRLRTTSATEVATRTALNRARALWSPVGSIVLVGGSSLIESFTW